MDKNLKAIKSFDQTKAGDIYQLSEDGKTYTCQVNYDNSYIDTRTGNIMQSKNSYTHEISTEYAKKLVESGYLSAAENKQDEYKNVFHEMEHLRNTYIKNLENLDEDYKDQPACVKIEAETVLTNMTKVLTYLLNLKR